MPMMTTPRLMLITIIATLAYLGLAILGWGGFAAFFSHPENTGNFASAGHPRGIIGPEYSSD
jgi:hypothetical protein